MEQKQKRTLKQKLIHFGSAYLLTIAILGILAAAVCKFSHQLEARATISDLAVTASLPANAKRMVGVGSLLDIPVPPQGEIPYNLRLPVDSISDNGGTLTLIAHLDSAETASLALSDSLTVLINTPGMTFFEYCFGW